MSTTFDRISLSIDSVAQIEEEVKTNVDHLVEGLVTLSKSSDLSKIKGTMSDMLLTDYTSNCVADARPLLHTQSLLSPEVLQLQSMTGFARVQNMQSLNSKTGSEINISDLAYYTRIFTVRKAKNVALHKHGGRRMCWS